LTRIEKERDMQNKRSGSVIILGTLGTLGTLGAIAVATTLLTPPRTVHSQAYPAPPNVKHYKYNLESNFIQMPLPPGEEAYGRLKGDQMEDYVKQIVAFWPPRCS
jgi:hypothetical protein